MCQNTKINLTARQIYIFFTSKYSLFKVKKKTIFYLNLNQAAESVQTRNKYYGGVGHVIFSVYTVRDLKDTPIKKKPKLNITKLLSNKIYPSNRSKINKKYSRYIKISRQAESIMFQFPSSKEYNKFAVLVDLKKCFFFTSLI